MNILQALFFPPEQPGGVSSMIPFMKERFVKQSWGMELFYLPKRVRGKGTEPVEFATFDWKLYKGTPVVDKYIQTYKDYIWWTKMRVRQRYDIIHAHHPIAALVMRQLFPGTPVLLTIHSSYERELILNGKIKADGPEHRFLTSLYRELEVKLDQILTVSASFKSYLAPYVEEPDKIGIVPNGFDESRFRPMPHENETLQFITMCRLVPAKGLDTLLEACSELKKNGHSFVLHIIGDGPIQKELEQMAVELDLYEETIFYGYMLHPEQFMPFFDIFVLPSRAEAFGSVFAEAALCRLALVGTNVGGIAEQIEHGYNGLLVPPGDSPALAKELTRLIEDAELRTRLAYAAEKKAKSRYSLQRVIRQLAHVYESYRTT
ncbi:glycosyltransferase family 4 protein [Paenibacillus sp. J2TS4]|uniref:glycosyltransferase family 4 protein n=1 Tax=Paenibacillus sp. J2TS4 TaxID=2807194 RepID=UPI001B2B4BDE|nr:glycosyltransferase family 4 protein [Paenibacillus sp. J2TS4]GIP33947.1 hypothetical protein J2TS4_31570 [Paenibacillus sp. J2TS4]